MLGRGDPRRGVGDFFRRQLGQSSVIVPRLLRMAAAPSVETRSASAGVKYVVTELP
jgi:hypothetical protein